MDQTLPGGQTTQFTPPQPVIPSSQPSVPTMQPISSAPPGGVSNDMASRSSHHNDILPIFLGLLAGALVASAYFVIAKPKTSNLPYNSEIAHRSSISQKSPPYKDNKFQPLPVLTALNDCGLTPEVQKIVDQNFITDAGLSLTIVGAVRDTVQYTSALQAALTLQKYQNNDTITIPIQTYGNGNIKDSKVVYNATTQKNEGLSSLQKGDIVMVTLFCRTPKQNNNTLPSSALITTQIKRTPASPSK